MIGRSPHRTRLGMQAVASSAIALYRYRALLYELVVRDVKLRYRGSILGFGWTLLNPILFMVIYTLVFAVYLRASIPHFPLYLLAGLVPWNWLSAAVSQAAGSIVEGRMYVGKTILPSELLVVVPVLSNGVNFLITLALLAPVALVLGVNLLWAVLWLPALILVELIVILGISFLVATFNVFYRDLSQLISYLLTAVFFLTPIFYARSAVPANLQFLVTFNPINGIIAGYQDVFYYARSAHAGSLAAAAGFGIVLLWIALICFNRYRDAFGEYL